MSKLLMCLLRALLRRCPACGGGPLFKSYFSMVDACPNCQLRLERDEGYYLGAIGLNIFFAEAICIGTLVGAMVITWPTPPWIAIWAAGMMGVGAGPVLFYPYSKTLWLALDFALFGHR